MSKSIAILMSTYNGEKYLGAQLKSISEQSLINDIAVYIRDDGSSDSTVSIVKKWMEKIEITLYEAPNVGPARSFWELLCNSNIVADYYLFCDQDDIWDKAKVEESVSVLHGNCVLSICNSRYIDKYQKIVKDKRLETIPELTLENLFVSGVAQGCVMAFSNKLRNFLIEKQLKYITICPQSFKN